MSRRLAQGLDRALWIAAAVFLLLGIQSCASSAGWEWQRTEYTTTTYSSDYVRIDSAAGGISIRRVRDNDSLAQLAPKLQRPASVSSSHDWFIREPHDLKDHGDSGWFDIPGTAFVGFHYQNSPQSYVFQAIQILWISYFHLALFAAVLPLYHFLRARRQRAQPFPWQFRKRRQWRNQSNGLCPQCAYDLRATPHQCPECGMQMVA